MKPFILIVDDQPEVLHSLERLFKEQYRVLTADSGAAGLELVQKHKPAVILSDQRMPGMTGVSFLAKSIETHPDAVRILITAYADIEASIGAVNMGQIFYYISKPWEPEEVELIVKRAMEKFLLVQENRKLTAALKKANAKLQLENTQLKQVVTGSFSFENLIGHSPKMLQVFKLAEKVIQTPTSVLLLGETGTGKELLAKAIHFNSNRKELPFIAQNCGALPETLLESELFGHVKGAFTGAVKSKKGIFEQAEGGTVFLDEVGDMSGAMQIRLLRVLQEGEIKPVGSEKIIRANARIIAATHKDLQKEVQEGRFREDLFYRLHIFPIQLPPLRERVEDIPDLAAHFIRKFSNKMGKKIDGLDQPVLACFKKYAWPGNVRELENELERTVILADNGGWIRTEHLSSHFHTGQSTSEFTADSMQSLKDEIELLEKERIHSALEKTGGNVSKAADILGLSRVGLHKKMKRYGIA